ncbi:MAG: diaminopimelate epimerase [Pseudomonadota bacterium]
MWFVCASSKRGALALYLGVPGPYMGEMDTAADMKAAVGARSASFVKMHGLGNDFVVFDARQQPIDLSPAQVKVIANRHVGVGCDQLMIIEPARFGGDVYLRYFNPNGDEVGACGNGTRCIGGLLFAESPREHVIIETAAGPLLVNPGDDGTITVDMGAPGLEWDAIPISQPHDTVALPIKEGRLINPVGVSMGNPHMVFFVEDIDAYDLAELGPRLEVNPLFPEKANVSIAQVTAKDHIQLKVWERGAGQTLACGTAACAALVAAVRRNMTDRQATVTLPGGDLKIAWRESDSHVLQSGPIAVAFMGMVEIPATT